MNAAKKKYFTVDEANRRLPLVRAIVGDIVRLYHDIHDRRQRLARIRQLPGANRRDEDNLYSQELQQIEDEIDKDITRLQEFVDELGELGIELKDPVVGLVDFLSRIDGRDAYLCWKLGEDEIAYWHELDAGYQGRQSLFEKLAAGDMGLSEESK
jgi:hypothetical protein